LEHALVFGSGGQDGRYLSSLCRVNGIEPIGCSKSPGPWITGDVADYRVVEGLIKQFRPRYIFHLAAISTTRHEALFENHAAISTGTLNILEATRLFAPAARVFLAASGLQFKNTGQPIRETDEFEATSPYAAARIQSVYAARYFRSRGLHVYAGYLFHHESPLRAESHLTKMIADLARRAESGGTETLEIGDLTVEKEYTFAGDVVRAIFRLVLQDEVFEAAIGSGKAYSVHQWLDACFQGSGKSWDRYVRSIDGYVPEYRRLVSDPRTMHKLGWTPMVQFPQLARMLKKQYSGTEEVLREWEERLVVRS
jgi:GDPmannose 4,6-dehydratase